MECELLLKFNYYFTIIHLNHPLEFDVLKKF